MTNKPKDETPREIMDKIYAMTPQEVSRTLGDHFKRMCSQPIPNGHRESQ